MWEGPRTPNELGVLLKEPLEEGVEVLGDLLLGEGHVSHMSVLAVPGTNSPVHHSRIVVPGVVILDQLEGLWDVSLLLDVEGGYLLLSICPSRLDGPR